MAESYEACDEAWFTNITKEGGLYDMIYNYEHATWFAKEVKDMRKDSHVKLSQADIKNWIFTINKIAALKNGATIFQEEELSEFEVPKALSQLIVPSKITVSLANFERDFRNKKYKTFVSSAWHKADDKDAYTPELLNSEEFNKVTIKLLRSFKFSETDTVKVSEMRKENTLANYQDRAIKSNKVVKARTAFIPVEVDFFKYEDDEYTYSVDKMFKQYINDNFILKNSGSTANNDGN